LKVLFINLLAALNFANVFKNEKRLENKKTLKNVKNVKKRNQNKKRKHRFLHLWAARNNTTVTATFLVII